MPAEICASAGIELESELKLELELGFEFWVWVLGLGLGLSLGFGYGDSGQTPQKVLQDSCFKQLQQHLLLWGDKEPQCY
ncbi:hypothetical protein H70357_02785 [Paenibacillus sp. FSL H7-0357]|uniref:hypothetical protein n=1 Tax=Paenibacillus sp. FSL H7-0357 TaxID=1536774 RepID=UPI0004F70D34|nr:hypothetical protein H70357_02785 [Paenibacillus sp. FSL H7-0357]